MKKLLSILLCAIMVFGFTTIYSQNQESLPYAFIQDVEGDIIDLETLSNSGVLLCSDDNYVIQSFNTSISFDDNAIITIEQNSNTFYLPISELINKGYQSFNVLYIEDIVATSDSGEKIELPSLTFKSKDFKEINNLKK